MNKIASLLVAGFAVAGVAGAARYDYLSAGSPAPGEIAPPASARTAEAAAIGGQSFPVGQNVRVEGGTQVIEIAAKGGYLPEFTRAVAGMPTVIRVVTSDTFDCSSYIAIPDLNFRKRLPLTGSTEIRVEAQAPGKTLTGLCGMAMYRFDIEFQS
jgi:hypothetical protein